MFQIAGVSSRVNLCDRAQKIENRARRLGGKRLGRIFVTCEVMIHECHKMRFGESVPEGMRQLFQ